MADVTIHDVLAWEPRLQLMRRPLPGAPATEDVGERDVSWAVTVRAAAPMLSPLRGGELVLLPDRVLSESGLVLPVLLRELGTHNVGAAVVETPPTVASAIPVLLAPDLSGDFESSLNRMLTERRGELYRAGTELSRLLSASGISTELDGLLRTAADFIGCPIALIDPRGSVLGRSGGESLPVGAARSGMTMLGSREWRDNRLLVKLSGGDVIWFGPVPRDDRALVRLASERIAIAVESVLQRTVDERPRGAARATALNALLVGPEDAAARNGPLLGLSTDGAYRVAIFDPAADLAGLQRLPGQIGVAQEAGLIEDGQAAVIAMRADLPNGRRKAGREGLQRGLGTALADVTSGWAAVSDEVEGAGALPNAARQARYIATLIRHRVLPPGVLLLDHLPDVGVYRLLYGLWGSPDLTAFVDDALGELRRRDRRGTFRETLLAYLDTGGSQVETAARLGIHRNTLSYRLRQIAQLIGRNPDDPEMRLVMHLALVAAVLPPRDS